jgi:hypothetical protein
MNERTRTGLEIITAAILMGLLGNVLLRQTPWGLNAFLFVTAFVAALVMLMRRHKPELLTANTFGLMGAMLFLASMFLLRDSEELLVYDTLGILVLMGVLLLSALGVKANIAGVFHYAVGFMWSGITSVLGPLFLLGSDIDWKAMPGNKISRTVFSILRGIAIALPLLLIFGGLFMAADAVFEGIVNNAISFDANTVASHIILTSLFAWLTAGYFRGAVLAGFASVVDTNPVPANEKRSGPEDSISSFVEKVAAEVARDSESLPNNATILEHINRSDPPNPPESSTTKKTDWQNFDSSVVPPVFTLGAIETVIVLGLVDLLFLGFVLVQVPYLFGGMDLVQSTPDFKLADYARRGFGELVAVSFLVLPILLLSHWLLRRDGKSTERVFRILAGVQIVLLFVIMASAVQRLVLLTGELGYGMTTVRFYPMVLMTWLAIVFVWFAITVLRGARHHFAWGALWSAVVILAATNLMNPDGFIARSNLQLMQQGREFDVHYNVGELSADAIPAILYGLPFMSEGDRCKTAQKLNIRLIKGRDYSDLRSWNSSRSNSLKLLESDRTLPTYAGCPEWMWSTQLDHAGQ